MNCYGHFRESNAKCKDCELATYCRDAGDPAPLGLVRFDKVDNLEEAAAVPDSLPSPSREFSAGHWMALVRRILEIEDRRIRIMLRLKIENPDISLAAIGSRFGITKQAVDKEIAFACSQMPELAVILRNRPMYNKWRSAPTHSPGNPSRVRRLTRNHGVQLEFSFSVDGSRKAE